MHAHTAVYMCAGMVVDMRQKQQTRTACELADTAVNAINQARAAAPDMPAIQTPAVRALCVDGD